MSDKVSAQLNIVRSLMEKRFVEMGQSVSVLDADALKEKFGRTTVVAHCLHFEVSISGIPCAHSVWNIGRPPDSQTATEALLTEFKSLTEAGRVASTISDVFNGLFTLWGELLFADEVKTEDRERLFETLAQNLGDFWGASNDMRKALRKLCDSL